MSLQIPTASVEPYHLTQRVLSTGYGARYPYRLWARNILN